MSWLMTVGIASVRTVFRTDASENKDIRSSFILRRLLVQTVDDTLDGKAVALLRDHEVM